MSSKPSRNDACPCGSGKKYKRCCLAADEAAARDRAQQLALLDDTMLDDLDFDDEDDYIDDVPSFDRHEITRVCYTRGFVGKLSDRRSGTGMQITEWEAPYIPEVVLDAIENDAVDTLEGSWGLPKITTPMQVDIIDVETDHDIVSIEVFNRAICLEHHGSPDLAIIDRACQVLEAVASGRAEHTTVRNGTVVNMAGVSLEASPPAAEFDRSALLKEHRRQTGTCALCGHEMTRQSARKHLAACAPAHDVAGAPEQRLIQIRATAPGLPAYWLDVEIGFGATLDVLDTFLRRIWLECCGHLSVFQIGDTKFFSRGYDFEFARPFAAFGSRRQPVERSMKIKVGAVLTAGEPFTYEYDFGSTTPLQMKVTDERSGRLGRPSVRLLARNTPPVWPCTTCGQAATMVCTYCLQSDGDPFACAAHLTEHACGEDEGFLPVVNSPRMGVCGYTGDA